MFNNIAVQWLIRRIPDWGGWVAVPVLALMTFLAGLSPAQQELVTNLLQGNWERVTLGALMGFVPVIYANIISYKATVRPQAIVEENGRLVSNPLSTAKEAEVAETVKNVKTGKSLLEIWMGK